MSDIEWGESKISLYGVRCMYLKVRYGTTWPWIIQQGIKNLDLSSLEQSLLRLIGHCSREINLLVTVCPGAANI